MAVEQGLESLLMADIRVLVLGFSWYGGTIIQYRTTNPEDDYASSDDDSDSSSNSDGSSSDEEDDDANEEEGHEQSGTSENSVVVGSFIVREFVESFLLDGGLFRCSILILASLSSVARFIVGSNQCAFALFYHP